MKRIGCFFGTFDPIHIGHLIIAQHMLTYAGLDEVRIVVSPQNPFKKDKKLSADRIRFNMVADAVAEAPLINATDIELDLPKPSYTSNTLQVLRKRDPDTRYDLIMGSDNLAGFHNWKDAQGIIENHRVLVYPRPGLDDHIKSARYQGHTSVNLINAPLLDISATRIREMVGRNESIRFLVVPEVLRIIEKEALYVT